MALTQAIRDPGNEVFLSVAAVWEASIKYHLGKWPLSRSLPKSYSQSSDSGMGLSVLSLTRTVLRRLQSCLCFIETHSTGS